MSNPDPSPTPDSQPVPQSNDLGTPTSSRRRLGARREAAKAETREALISSAMAAFAEEGLDNPSLDAICARAGYTRGAFYVHFQDREELINAVGERMLASLLASVSQFDESPAALSNLIGRLFSRTTDEDGGVPLHQFLHAVGRSEALRERYRETLRQAAEHIHDAGQLSQARAGMRGDVDALQLTWLLLALATGLQALNEVGAPVQAQRSAELMSYLLRRN